MGDELRRRLRKLEDLRGSGTPGAVVIWRTPDVTDAELDDRIRAVQARGATAVILSQLAPGEPPNIVELTAELAPERRTRQRAVLFDPAQPPPPPERPAT